MNFRRTMLLLLLFLLLLLPVVWFSAPLWLSKAAEYILAQQQCSAVIVDFKTVGWNKSHINRLYCKDQKKAFEADITDVDISYSLTGLMDKRIGHVKIESAAFQLRSSSEAKAEAIPILTTPALLMEALPLSSFDIRNIYVQRQDSKGVVLQALKGFATYSDQGLSLVLNEDTHLKGLQLKVVMDKNNGVRAALSQGKISILNIESTLHKTDELLSVGGTADIELAPLSTALKPWLNMPDQQLEGKLHASWQVSLPAQGNKPLLQQLNASTALKLDFALNRPDLGPSRGKVSLNLKFKQGLGTWDITEKSQIHLGDKQKTMIDLSGLSGSFALTKLGWRAAVAEKSKLQVKHIHIDDMLIPHAQISVSTPIEIATGQGDKSLLQQLRGSVAVDVDFVLKRPGLSRGSLNLNLELKQGLGAWSIGKRSQISFGGGQKTIVDLSGLSGSFSFAESGWSAIIAGKSNLQAKNIHIDDMLIPHVYIRATTPVEVAKTSKGNMRIVQKAAITITLPSLQWQGNSLASRDLKLVIHRGSVLSPSGSFIASAIKFTSPTLQLPVNNISGTFDFSAKQISVAGKVDAQESGVHLTWRLKHQPARQKGFLAFSFEPLLFGAASIDLSRVVKSQGDYAIDNGTLELNGRLQWKKGGGKQKTKLGAQFQMKLSNLKGHYKTNQFSGLSGNLYFTGHENKLLMAPALITLESLQAGVPVNNISMSAAFTYPFAGLASMEINQLTAEALGGRISSENISIDLARASNPFLVKLEHLDAGKAVEIRQQEGLHVKGLLDGNLPFDWTPDGLKMISGELKSTSAGGLIRYLGTESVRKFAATDKATKMVLDIMNNFHYKHLKIGANYLPDGELKMSIKLKGNNPGYENGRSVALNFNIEENLLKLLQGLGITGNISDALEKRVQKKLQRE